MTVQTGQAIPKCLEEPVVWVAFVRGMGEFGRDASLSLLPKVCLTRRSGVLAPGGKDSAQ